MDEFIGIKIKKPLVITPVAGKAGILRKVLIIVLNPLLDRLGLKYRPHIACHDPGSDMLAEQGLEGVVSVVDVEVTHS